MKIVFYYSSIYNGGAERVITALANDFVERGDTIAILTQDDGKCGYQLSDKVSVCPLYLIHDSRNLCEAVVGIFKEICILRNYCINTRPDIIIAFANRMAVIAKWATVGLRIKVIGSERGNPFVERRKWKERLFVKQARILDGFIFQTDGAKRFYPKSIQKKSAVIPNGIFIASLEKKTNYSDRKMFSLISTGRITLSKRYDVMVDAMKEVVNSFPNATLDIYGTGDYYEEVKQYIQKTGMQDHVFMRGRVTNVQEHLASHQIFLLASENEGMPNGLIEAMAAGCVCISSDCDFGPSELITNGVDGLLYPVGDAKQLAKHIIEMFSNVQKATEIGHAALEINDRLSFPVIADKFYNYLLSR